MMILAHGNAYIYVDGRRSYVKDKQSERESRKREKEKERRERERRERKRKRKKRERKFRAKIQRDLSLLQLLLVCSSINKVRGVRLIFYILILINSWVLYKSFIYFDSYIILFTFI